MEKIDAVEYDKLFPRDKEFVEWVKSRERQGSIVWITVGDVKEKKNIFDPFNTINS